MKNSKLQKKDGVDIVSNLPDAILHLILSRVLTTEEVTRTSILSRRWRYLWTSVPSIDVDFFREFNPLKELKKKKFDEFVHGVLANKSINLDSFCLICGDHFNMWTMGRWIQAAVRRHVKLIDLMFYLGYEDDDVIELPHCLMTCKSLEVLKLTLGSCRLSLPKFTDFPALRVVKLNCLELSDQDLVKEFLKSCPLLEDLSLVDCLTHRLGHFCISCPKLMNLRIDNQRINGYPHWENASMCKRLQICCPKLVFLEFGGFITNEFILESVDSLQKAVVLPDDTFEWRGEKIWMLIDGISHVESLSLSICFIEKYINVENLPKSLPNLKTLELTTKFYVDNMDVLIQILACSPKLECFHMIIEEGSSSPAEAPPNFDFVEMECTFKELKMVKVTGISAIIPHHMGFIEFLLLSSPVLETMSIAPYVNMTDGILSFLTALQSFPRASPKAEIITV